MNVCFDESLQYFDVPSYSEHDHIFVNLNEMPMSASIEEIPYDQNTGASSSQVTVEMLDHEMDEYNTLWPYQPFAEKDHTAHPLSSLSSSPIPYPLSLSFLSSSCPCCLVIDEGCAAAFAACIASLLLSCCCQVIIIRSLLASAIIIVGGMVVDMGGVCGHVCMVRDSKWLCAGMTHHVHCHCPSCPFLSFLPSLVVNVPLWEGVKTGFSWPSEGQKIKEISANGLSGH